MPRRRGALSDTAIRPSVCPSVPWRGCPKRAAALGYRHTGCLQLTHVRAADLRPRTDVDPPRVELPSAGWGISSRRPRGDSLSYLAS